MTLATSQLTPATEHRPTRTWAVRRLLVITYHFPPDGSVGGQRWAGLTKYLARMGWEVHVITASGAPSGESNPGVHRHVAVRRQTLNDMYNAAAARVKQPEVSGPSTPVKIPVANGGGGGTFELFAAVRRVVGSAMYLPDQGRGWVTRAAGIARRLMRRKHFDLVISTGPPHSAHFAGLLATRGTGTEFWMDMRDPWSLTHEMHRPADRFIRAERATLRLLEKVVFRSAATVIVNTEEFAQALRTLEPRLNVVWLSNGVDAEQLPVRNLGDVRPGSIAHVGSLYANRSLSTVFEAMAAVSSRRGSSADPLTLNIAGPLESPHRERMQDDIASAGISSAVRVHGVIPRKQALQLLTQSHLALVLAQDQPLCVPAKLYESVGLGIPTLVIAEETSAAAREARRIGAMTVESDDLEGLTSIFDDLVRGLIPLSVSAKEPISYADKAATIDGLMRAAN